MKSTTAYNTELWEAWIEYDHSDSKNFATLYVIADMSVDDSDHEPRFRRMMNSTKSHLRLELQGVRDEFGVTYELIYSESIVNLNMINTVSIYCGGKLVKRFRDIDVLV